MQKLKSFFIEYGYIVIIAFMSLTYLQTCNQNSNIKSLKKEIVTVKASNDSLSNNLKKEIKMEGLRSELRMIQATDRKIMDVQRQNQIEQEIKSIQNTK
jgi:hypothetical protein